MSNDKKDIRAYRGTRKMIRTIYLCRCTSHQYPHCFKDDLLQEGLSRWRLFVT